MIDFKNYLHDNGNDEKKIKVVESMLTFLNERKFLTPKQINYLDGLEKNIQAL